MENDGKTRRVWWAATGGERRRGVFAAFCAVTASLLPVCSGCREVVVERRPAMHADGLFRELLVGGSEPDGAFVVARHELAPGDDEVVVVSLADDKQRTCSLGKAVLYDAIEQHPGLEGITPPLDPRPARILTVEGDPGAESGDLRVFDASCVERMLVPSVEARVEKVNWAGPEAYAVRTTSGEVVMIDPWAGSVQTIAEGASFWAYAGDNFWLIEGGSLVLRDRNGKSLQTAGEAVTEVAVSPNGEEAAYVDAKGLWVLKAGDPGPIAIPTTAAPCKPAYAWGGGTQRLTYRDDCAAGVLGILDRATGETRVLSTGVTSVFAFRDLSMAPWVFFAREEPGKKRELWAVPEAGEPFFVGTNPRPSLFALPHYKNEDFLVDLDYDGATATLGKWSPEGGFSPLLEGFWRSFIGTRGYLPTITDPQEELGTLVVLDIVTLAEVLRVPGVQRETPRGSLQVRAINYVHDWDETLEAGTLTTWIPGTAQPIDVGTGVSEFSELISPEPGVVYAVRTPERAGLWTAYPDL